MIIGQGHYINMSASFTRNGVMIHFAEIKQAYERIKPWIIETPLIKSDYLSELLNAEVYLKLECLQKTGSFKVRGAFNSVLCLGEKEKQSGVLTVSSGNHAVALAYVCKKLGLKTTVIMPENAPKSKIEKAQSYGAEIILYGRGYQEALTIAKDLLNKTRTIFIHSYDDENVIRGHGTIGIELFQQLPDLEVVSVGVGGGALCAGVALTIKTLKPEASIVAVQPEKVATLGRSLELGIPTPLSSPAKTLADGLATGNIGATALQIMKSTIDKHVTVKEHELARTILLLLKHEKILSEGAGAASVAGIMNLSNQIEGKKVVCIISGGNIDMELLKKIISQ